MALANGTLDKDTEIAMHEKGIAMQYLPSNNDDIADDDGGGLCRSCCRSRQRYG